MKKLLVTLTLCVSMLSFGQTPGEDNWLFSAGINTVNNLGTLSPYNSPGEWAYNNPFSISAEYVLDYRFSIDFSLNFNGFDKGDRMDTTIADDDYNYFSFDPSVKYYFGDLIFSPRSPFHLYGTAGLGFFTIDEGNVSFNVGGGLMVWLNSNDSIGLKVQTLAKFAFDNKLYESNHFQHHLQLVFQL